MKKLSKGNIVTIIIVALIVIFVFSRMEIESSDDTTTETTQTEVKKETAETTVKTTEETAAKLKNEYKLDDTHFADASVKKIVATINDDQMELSFKWVNDSHDEKTSFIQAGLYVDVTQNEEVIPEKDNLFGTVGGNISYQAKQGIETPIVAKYELQNSTDPIKITIGVTDDTEMKTVYELNLNEAKIISDNSLEIEKEIKKPSEKQKEWLVVQTQRACKDRGIKLTYQGEDTWNIAINYIDNKNKWIVTNIDKNYGRVKAIYNWNGDTEEPEELIYLLVKGEELINKLHD